MSIKRQATVELNHDNWDQDEPTDQDMGTFKTASKDVLEKRIIRTGKRRFYGSSDDDVKKNVFSGFQGFKKPQPSSFDFLKDLTNGTKTTSNGSVQPTLTDPSSTSTSLFGLKSSTPSGSLFLTPAVPVTCDASAKPTNIFGPAIKSSVFQTPPSTVASYNSSSIFSSSKGDSMAGQPSFQIPSTSNTAVANNFLNSTKPDVSTTASTTLIQNKSPVFGTASFNQSTSSTPISSNSKLILNNSDGSLFKKTENIATDSTSMGKQTKDTNSVKFYSKLVSLNKAVTEWVKKHVEDTPVCILTPIFRDYEKYLKELQNKYGMENIENELALELQPRTTNTETKTSNSFELPIKPLTSNLFTNEDSKNKGNSSLFDTRTDTGISKDSAVSSVGSKPTSTNPPFSFGTSTKSTSTFSFGTNNSILNTSLTNSNTVASPFAKSSTMAVSTPKTTTFSFNVNNQTTTVSTALPNFSFGDKPNTTDATPTFSFSVIPSSVKAEAAKNNTLFSMTTAIDTPKSFFTSSSTPMSNTSTFSFDAKSMSSSSLTSSICSTVNTMTSVSSTFSFSPKSSSTAAVSPFIVNVTTSQLSTTSTSTTFSFMTKSPLQSTTAAPGFSFNMNAPVNTVAGSKPFSFGMGKPFTFNTEKKTETSQQAEKEEDDEPPKTEFTPVVEENSVYDKRCKVYVKKDGNFVDKGVGTLYIKKVDDNEKHQLLVRANTNLGNILINLILSKSIPMQRMGKNDVMMGCIPTPDEKPPPIPVLIRVKTSEEADELLEALNKHV